MIGRADIEGSKSNVAMIAWLPQASYPCGNFSDTPNLIIKGVMHPHLTVYHQMDTQWISIRMHHNLRDR